MMIENLKVIFYLSNIFIKTINTADACFKTINPNSSLINCYMLKMEGRRCLVGLFVTYKSHGAKG